MKLTKLTTEISIMKGNPFIKDNSKLTYFWILKFRKIDLIWDILRYLNIPMQFIMDQYSLTLSLQVAEVEYIYISFQLFLWVLTIYYYTFKSKIINTLWIYNIMVNFKC